MHSELVKRLGLLALLALALPGPGRTQEADPAAPGLQAVEAVMRYRVQWMGDRLPFDECSVRRVFGTAPQQPLGIHPSVAHWMDAPPPGGCPVAAASSPEHGVSVNSVLVHPSVAAVHLMVRRGEHVHREHFRLQASPAGGWAVEEARLWGAIRLHRSASHAAEPDTVLPTVTSLPGTAARVRSAERGGHTCPAETSWLRQLVEHFALSASHLETRAEMALAGASPSSLRLLSDSTDTVVCQQLNALVSPGGKIGPSDFGPWAYYTFGGKYLLVSGTAPSTTHPATGFDVLAVVDGNLEVVEILAI